MKLFRTLWLLLCFGTAWALYGQSPMPNAATKSVTMTPAGLLTGSPSTNLFALNTNLLFRTTAIQANALSNALVAAIGATNASRTNDIVGLSNGIYSALSSASTARIGEINSLSNGVYSAASTATAARVGEINSLSNSLGSSLNGLSNGVYAQITTVSSNRIVDINSSSNTLSASISSLASSVSSSISSAISTATSSITSAYTSAVTAAKYQINLLSASRSVNSIADLIAMRTDSLPGATNGLTVFVRGYYDREGDGGGTFHLAPVYSLPADITGTNRGTCFATADATNLYWIRRDRIALSVKDFGAFCLSPANDHAAVQDAVNNALDITFPLGTTTKLGSGGGNAIDVPAGRQLHVKGAIVGPDYFRFAGSVVVDGGGTISLSGGVEPRLLQFLGGDVCVRDLAIVGTGGEFALYVDKSASMNSFSVDRIRFEKLQIGVLREAWSMSTPNPFYEVKKARVQNCTFTNIFAIGGDWEPNLGDGSVDIIDNRFDWIHFQYNGSNGFGGYAFAVAGWLPDNWGNETNQLHRITFRGNVVSRARLGLHAEYCTDVEFSNNHFKDIDEGYGTVSTNTLTFPGGITAGIEVFGCQRTIVSGNTFARISGSNRYAVFAGFGWNGSEPQAGMDRLIIANNVAETGDFYATMMPRVVPATNSPNGLVIPRTALMGNITHDGRISIQGRGQWTLLNNYARAPWGQTALTVDLDPFFSSTLQSQLRMPITLQNNIAINPIGVPSYAFADFEDADNESNLVITASGNNFPVQTPSQKAQNAGTVYFSTNGVPFGFTFKTGDIIIDTSKRPPKTILVTQGGSRSYPGDYCNPQPATNAVKGWVSAATFPWSAGGYHHMGQLVRITGTPGTVTGMISDLFIDSGTASYVARIVNPTTGNPLDLTDFVPSQMYALNEVQTTTEGGLTTTWDPPSIAAGGITQLSALNVPGALPGDQVLTSFSKDTAGLLLVGSVTTNDYCRIVLYNPTTNTVDLASGTLRVSTRTP